jgi:membrane-bound serine protease (ClpP class)
MRKWFFIALLLLGLSLLVAGGVSAAGSQIDVLRVDGTINPVLAGYIDRGIESAEKHGSTACIIELDTPGGLDSSMRDIVQDILEADVPVVVYVPPGSRAASAGAFITLAAHVAAMAPGTEIGAAHPVGIGEEIDDVMEEKVVNDAVAYIRSIADMRGRNADWAEAAVRESKSSPALEALELGVIDTMADNFDQLIIQLDGREVTLLSGEAVTLNTENADINYIDMGVIERFLFIISDPNIAYFLRTLQSRDYLPRGRGCRLPLSRFLFAGHASGQLRRGDTHRTRLCPLRSRHFHRQSWIAHFRRHCLIVRGLSDAAGRRSHVSYK